MGRWGLVAAELATVGLDRMASANQVHGARVLTHGGGWQGWLRDWEADGHVTTVVGTALVVTVADCTPVLVAHPAGAVAALHAGWRGTAAGILSTGLNRLASLGFPATECHVYLGPAICGACYEVGPEVLSAVTGRPAAGKGCLDVRAVLSDQAWAAGVRQIVNDPECTRCGPERWFSHRGGDAGRQIAIIGCSAP
jgi:YfiH family protein